MAEQENPWKVSVKEEMNKNPQLKLEDIQNVRAWLSSQSHLPYVYGRFYKMSQYVFISSY